jgi:hypothetical protein
MSQKYNIVYIYEGINGFSILNCDLLPQILFESKLDLSVSVNHITLTFEESYILVSSNSN